MTPRPATVQPSTPVSVALQRMAALGIGRMPVVADADPGKLVGMFRREDAVRSYHYALSMNTGRRLDRQRGGPFGRSPGRRAARSFPSGVTRTSLCRPATRYCRQVMS
jgi:hypothetical protein